MTPIPPSPSGSQPPSLNLDDIVAYLRERDIMWFGESEVTEREMQDYHKLARAMIAEAVADQRNAPIQGSVVTVFHPFGESNDAIKYTFSENCKVNQTEDNVFFVPDEGDEDPDCISISRSGGIMIHVAHKRQILASDVGVSIVKDGVEKKIYQGEDLSKVIETTIAHAPKAVAQSVERVERAQVQIPTMHAFPAIAQQVDLPVPLPRPARDIPTTSPAPEDSEE